MQATYQDTILLYITTSCQLSRRRRDCRLQEASKGTIKGLDVQYIADGLTLPGSTIKTVITTEYFGHSLEGWQNEHDRGFMCVNKVHVIVSTELILLPMSLRCS